jgi:hypothetical protein
MFIIHFTLYAYRSLMMANPISERTNDDDTISQDYVKLQNHLNQSSNPPTQCARYILGRLLPKAEVYSHNNINKYRY